MILPSALAGVLIVILAATGIAPPIGHTTWFLEVVPVMLALLICATTYRRFPLSRVAYVCIFVHALILIYGGYYGYAQTPLGDWMRETWNLQRNNYDRIGHLAQGFVPAVIVREVLLRRSTLSRGAWLNVVTVGMCLAISASYELFEWWVAVALEGGSTDFLGTQGDPWDTQWDMFCALIGATVSVVCLRQVHDKSLRALE